MSNGALIMNSAATAAQQFSIAYNTIKSGDPNARVFAGGLLRLNAPQTKAWWTAFVTKLKDDGVLYKLEGVHVHLYPGYSAKTDWSDGASYTCTLGPTTCLQQLATELIPIANTWYQTMHVGLGLEGIPIWITETGFLTCNSNLNRAMIAKYFMPILRNWFDSPNNPGYKTMAWFTTYAGDTRFICHTLMLTQRETSGAVTEVGQFWNSWWPSATGS